MSNVVTMKQKMDPLYLIKWIAAISIPVAILLIPVNDVFSREIRLFAALSLAMILMACFDFFNIIVPSVLLPIGYFITGVVPSEVAFGAWTQNVVWVVLGAFLMTAVFKDIGLLNRIAYWVILKAGGTYTRTVWAVLLSAILLSQVTFGNAYVLMAALAYGVCRSLGLGRGKEAAVIMFAALLGSSTVRGVIYSPDALSLLNHGAQSILPDFELLWTNQLLQCAPIFLWCVLFTFVMLKTLKVKPDVNGKAFFQEEYDRMGKFSTAEKKGVVVLAVLLLYLCTGSVHGQSLDYGFMIIPWLMYMPGLRIGTENAIKELDLPMLFFVVACLSIGNVSSALGIGQILATLVEPFLVNMNNTIILYVVILIGTILNFLMTPLAFLSGFSGPLTQIAVNLGFSPAAALYTLNFAADLVFLPYEYVPYLIFFSFGIISVQDFVRLNALKYVLFLAFFGLVMVPYWQLIGLL